MSEVHANISLSRQARLRSRFYFHLHGVITDQASRGASLVLRASRLRVNETGFQAANRIFSGEMSRYFMSERTYESVISTRLHFFTIARLGL